MATLRNRTQDTLFSVQDSKHQTGWRIKFPLLQAVEEQAIQARSVECGRVERAPLQVVDDLFIHSPPPTLQPRIQMLFLSFCLFPFRRFSLPTMHVACWARQTPHQITTSVVSPSHPGILNKQLHRLRQNTPGTQELLPDGN
ncbi:hypothetical protein RRG08_039468 [Elysia crispata]|uniref:Uncharacterized protein n=1 Tax=Elysia crispata TaxID=231223 RepID=A0AAE1D019_9GAST|nr:hypothetical protein RRG08_039468 [Elysia crispata]